jgi:hypothetical protein
LENDQGIVRVLLQEQATGVRRVPHGANTVQKGENRCPMQVKGWFNL